MIGKIGLAVVIIGIAVILGGLISLYFNVNLPADTAYNRSFGFDVNMITKGSTSLVGINGTSDEGSMHYYLIDMWSRMNQTWGNIPNDQWNVTYANVQNFWLGTLNADAASTHNTLAATNQYFNSLNSTIYQKQEIINRALTSGNIFTNDPVQQAINATRDEINAYGGIDWVVRDLFMRTQYPDAYWSPVTALTYLAIAIVLWVIGIALILYSASRSDY
jgi:hypothetical protein